MAKQVETIAVEEPPAATPPARPIRRPNPILQRVVAEISKVPGFCAVGLGGSRSIGTGTPASDYDVIIFSSREEDIDQEAAARAVESLGGVWPSDLRKPLAEMTINGHKVELFFRHMDRIASEIAAARKGIFKRTINPLHTIGFLSTIVVSYATYAYPLWDPDQKLRRLVQSAFPYPDMLRDRMIKTFRTEAKIALIHAGKVRSIGDVAHLMGCYSRAHAAWALVLFASNRRYPVIDKGGRQLVAALPIIPANFEFRTMAIFRAAAAGDLKGARQEANRLHDEIVELTREGTPVAPAAPG